MARDKLDQVRFEVLPADIEQVGGGLDEFFVLQKHVAVAGGLFEGVHQPRFETLRRVLGDAQRAGDLVGAPETDAAHVVGQPVGVFAQHGNRAVAVAFVDADGLPDPDAVALKKEHDGLNRLLGFPGLPDLGGPFPADALDVAEPMRLFVDDTECLDTEGIDQPFGESGSDTVDETRAQVLLDTQHRCGKHRLVPFNAELPPPLLVVDPLAPQAHRLARRNRHEVSYEGRQVPALVNPQPSHEEAGFRVLIDDPLDRSLDARRAGNVLGVFKPIWFPAVGHAVLPHVPDCIVREAFPASRAPFSVAQRVDGRLILLAVTHARRHGNRERGHDENVASGLGRGNKAVASVNGRGRRGICRRVCPRCISRRTPGHEGSANRG